MEIPLPPCYTLIWALTIPDLRKLLQRKPEIGLANKKLFFFFFLPLNKYPNSSNLRSLPFLRTTVSHTGKNC